MNTFQNGNSLPDTVSSRPSTRSPEEIPKIPALQGKNKNKGNDSSCPCRNPQSPCGTASQRVSRQRLEELLRTLSQRDVAILTSIRLCKYLTSGQIRRLHFRDSATELAATRNTNRILRQLKNRGLILPFGQQIGGRHGGSSAMIWHLTEAGMRFLYSHEDGKLTRKRFLEPSSTHLRHTVAVAECYIELLELDQKYEELKIAEITLEPACWRPFGYHGRTVHLKPDLFAIIENGEYEDRWFIEVDLSTEDLRVIEEKCNRYHCYYETGQEQRKTGVFPFILWIVPDGRRKHNLIECIKQKFLKRKVHLFTVITSDQLEDCIRNGPAETNIL